MNPCIIFLALICCDYFSFGVRRSIEMLFETRSKHGNGDFVPNRVTDYPLRVSQVDLLTWSHVSGFFSDNGLPLN